MHLFLYRHASNHLFQGTSIQQNLFIPNFVQSLFAQFSFLLLAILLPRSLEYQCRLMHQWKMKVCYEYYRRFFFLFFKCLMTILSFVYKIFRIVHIKIDSQMWL